jgi:hypothetical protein
LTRQNVLDLCHNCLSWILEKARRIYFVHRFEVRLFSEFFHTELGIDRHAVDYFPGRPETCPSKSFFTMFYITFIRRLKHTTGMITDSDDEGREDYERWCP